MVANSLASDDEPSQFGQQDEVKPLDFKGGSADGITARTTKKNTIATGDFTLLDGILSRTTTREIDDHSNSSSSTVSDGDSFAKSNDEPPHSMLTYNEKWVMVILLTMCGFWSSLGSPIYYPALKQLEKQFDVDEDMVNVTVVVYLIFQGIAPTFSGGLADIYGRRPVILLGMLVYVVASIGLACCNSYGVIVFLRCLQSAGISPIIAISSGCVGDFTLKAERGTFVGAVSGLVLLGQGFGSLIGAALTAAWDWRAIFWFLTIGCGASFVIASLLLLETKRTLVGNLSVPPKSFINRAPVTYLKPIKERLGYDKPFYQTLDPNVPKLDLTSAFKILFQPEIVLSLFPGGLQFAMWTIMLSAISSELSTAPYNYKLTIIGVCYLPAGIGGLFGSLITGRIIDFYYKRQLREFQRQKDEGIISEDAEFNVFKARLLAAIPQNFLAVASFMLFGWSVDKGWAIPAALITSCVSSFCTMSTLSTSSTLLVDLYPGKSSTATSCFNFIRCSLSAIFMGCFADMKKSITVGGTFTLVSAMVFVCNFLIFIPMRFGMQFRRKRAIKAELKAQERLNDNSRLNIAQKVGKSLKAKATTLVQ